MRQVAWFAGLAAIVVAAAGCSGGSSSAAATVTAGPTTTVTAAQGPTATTTVTAPGVPTTVTVTAAAPQGDAGQDGAPSTFDTTTAATSTRPSAASPATTLLTGNAKPKLVAGTAGQIAIVATGKYDGEGSQYGGSVPIVVRNNTDQAVREITATGSATNAQGKLVASGSDQGFHPDLVQPGQIAIGYVYFDGGSATTTSKFDIQLSSDPANSNSGYNYIDAKISDVNVTGRTMLGTLANPTTDATMGSGTGVSILCFSAAGQILDFVSGGGRGEAHKLTPGAKTTFSVDLGDTQCPTYLIGGGGYPG